jgi:hypothetical protein
MACTEVTQGLAYSSVVEMADYIVAMERAHLSVACVMTLAMACRGAPPEVGATPDPQLESMINQQAESAAPGSVMVNEALFRGVAYDRGEFQDFRVELVKGNCYVFVAASDQTATALHLFVWDPEDKKVADDKSKTREALAQTCPKQTGTYKVQGKIARGAGHFAIGVFGKEAPEGAVAEAEPVPVPMMGMRMGRRSDALHARQSHDGILGSLPREEPLVEDRRVLVAALAQRIDLGLDR